MKKKSSAKNARTAQPPVTDSSADKLLLIGVPFLLLGAITLFMNFTGVRNHEASISRTVEKWKLLYHLEPSKVERIKEMEITFHGNGSLFSIKGQPDREQNHQHHLEISRLMSAEDGERFMKTMGEDHSP